MLLQKVIGTVNSLENPEYPLLGPNITGLYWFGLWQSGRKYRDVMFNLVHFCSLLFVISQFLELYCMEKDLMKVLFNVTISALGLVSISKTLFFKLYLKHWKLLIKNISGEEIHALSVGNKNVINYMKQYKSYSRKLTYMYWCVMLMTIFVTILSPYQKLFSKNYRDLVRNGTEPYPQMLSSWFPFDNTKTPGTFVSSIVHILVLIQGCGIIAVYDSNAVTIMSFLKGQMQILKYKSKNIFGCNDEVVSRDEVISNIKECHRLHNFFIEQFKLFNAILSPVMFVYILVCSIMICCGVVQLSAEEVAISQKLWVIEYTAALAIQLFLYCWHSNEIAYESNSVDLGVYTSNWWHGDVKLRRQVLLLAGKLSPTFILDAGPFNKFSMTTFINIMKGSYSFYTLFTQMHENKE